MPSLLTMLIVTGVLATTDATPAAFVVGDTDVTIAVPAAEGDALTLSAFGNVVSKEHIVTDSQVRLHVPPVRSRTLFELHDMKNPKACVAEFAAYPRAHPEWSKKPINVVALSAPPWFSHWAAAMGIDVKSCSSVQLLPQFVSGGDARQLLVLGRESGQDHPRDVLELARTYSANIIVLDATWYERNVSAPVEPKFAKEPSPLSKLRDWSWGALPRFDYSRRPRLRYMNRLAVASDGHQSLIEVFLQPDNPQWAVANYLPWEQHLGRSDAADALLSTLLRETAFAESMEPLDGKLIVHFAEVEADNALRPVLACAMAGASDSTAIATLDVIDLRGTSETTLTARALRQTIDAARGEILILGDDPALQYVRGLPDPNRGLNPERHQSKRILWLPDDALPPTEANQEQLMRVFTRYRIPLKPAVENES